MQAPWSRQLSAAKTGWLVMLLFFGWLGYLLVPAPKPDPAPPPAFIVKPPSRLVELGLPDNPDLDHLPEFFALYADKAEWKDDKTIFAYWNPGSNSYSYFFEARRAKDDVRFRTITKKELFQFKEFQESGDYVQSDYLENNEDIEKFEFTTDSSTHPLLFFISREIRIPVRHIALPSVSKPSPESSVPKKSIGPVPFVHPKPSAPIFESKK